MRIRLLLTASLLTPLIVQANDSSGFIGTGGIEYLENPYIKMLSEDLYISKQQIRVAYQFKNQSKQDIHETILFPLPILERFYNSDFANTAALVKSFKVQVNGKNLQPDIHVRAFMHAHGQTGKPVDVTESLKKCGFSDSELMAPWTEQHNNIKLHKKLSRCNNPQIHKLKAALNQQEDTGHFSPWAAQIIYSWKQTFKASSITEVQHQYTPLVGSSIHFDARKNKENTFYTTYCIDDNFRRKMKTSGKNYPAHSALSYILTTGANWAGPIGTFTLTIERDPNELVSLCWDKSLKKVGPNHFRAVKHNFIPTRDLDIIFAEGI
ncbi:DUF4424 family protein [Neisseria sp. 83E34]|uniref:DUF4424 family protein n=1 Tax=Neisseria sp. 83E34 TaxID=1692264 RepID=UPI0006CE82E1|nr:DUF4424 family protein [Neisseria sp. 83E34]KPN72305.1 hypothetical protein AKG09_00120 [Neisseria sp. 83E34]